MKRTLIIALLAVAAVAAANFAYAAIPSADGTITACKDNHGSLKVIDTEAGQKCSGNQKLLSWNQRGPAGAPGTQIGFVKVWQDGTIEATSYDGLVTVEHPYPNAYDFTNAASLSDCRHWFQGNNAYRVGTILENSTTTFRVNTWDDDDAQPAQFTVFYAC